MNNVLTWQRLVSSAVHRKIAGDIDGAIDEMMKAIDVAKSLPNFAKDTARNLNFLADLYLMNDAYDQAEEAIREAIEVSRPLGDIFLGDHLFILTDVQCRKGQYREALASAEECLQMFQKKGYLHGVQHMEGVIEKIKTNLESS